MLTFVAAESVERPKTERERLEEFWLHSFDAVLTAKTRCFVKKVIKEREELKALSTKTLIKQIKIQVAEKVINYFFEALRLRVLGEKASLCQLAGGVPYPQFFFGAPTDCSNQEAYVSTCALLDTSCDKIFKLFHYTMKFKDKKKLTEFAGIGIQKNQDSFGFYCWSKQKGVQCIKTMSFKKAFKEVLNDLKPEQKNDTETKEEKKKEEQEKKDKVKANSEFGDKKTQEILNTTENHYRVTPVLSTAPNKVSQSLDQDHSILLTGNQSTKKSSSMRKASIIIICIITAIVVGFVCYLFKKNE